MLILRSDGSSDKSISWIPAKPGEQGNCYYSGQASDNVAHNAPIVLTVDNIDNLKEFLSKLHLILESAAFSDGRIFSLSSQLRMLGFKGKLTLTGDILPDQVSYAFRCGIDEIQFVDEQKFNRAEKLITPFTKPYQTF